MIVLLVILGLLGLVISYWLGYSTGYLAGWDDKEEGRDFPYRI